MRPRTLAVCIFAITLHISIAPADAQVIEPVTEKHTAIQSHQKYLLMAAGFDILRDERTMWEDLLRIRPNEMKWIVPIASVNALAISTDAVAYKDITTSNTIKAASHAVSSLGAPYPLFATGASMYLLGRYTDDLRLRETGILGTQALVHSIIMTGALESATNRKLPNGSEELEFWSGGDAWPSGHASMFWALSTVIAEQYRDRASARFGAYSLATAVSVSR